METVPWANHEPLAEANPSPVLASENTLTFMQPPRLVD
jgi:hypothetical protein